MPIDFNKRVRITKTRSNDERSQANYAEGYWVAGLIPFGQRPVEGGILLLDRDTRNGVEIAGCFRSSIIREAVIFVIGGIGEPEETYMLIATTNSTYKVTQDENVD